MMCAFPRLINNYRDSDYGNNLTNDNSVTYTLATNTISNLGTGKPCRKSMVIDKNYNNGFPYVTADNSRLVREAEEKVARERMIKKKRENALYKYRDFKNKIYTI